MDGRSILKKFEIDCNLINDIDDYDDAINEANGVSY